MRRAAAIAALTAFVACGTASASGGLPGARAVKVCAAAGPYWPTMTLALSGSSAWVACKEQSRVVRVSTRTGKTTRSVRLGGAAIAVRAGFRAIWALDSGATLYRLSPKTGRIARRISLGVAAAYNIWIGGRPGWGGGDQGGEGVGRSPPANPPRA